MIVFPDFCLTLKREKGFLWASAVATLLKFSPNHRFWVTRWILVILTAVNCTWCPPSNCFASREMTVVCPQLGGFVCVTVEYFDSSRNEAIVGKGCYLEHLCAGYCQQLNSSKSGTLQSCAVTKCCNATECNAGSLPRTTEMTPTTTESPTTTMVPKTTESPTTTMATTTTSQAPTSQHGKRDWMFILETQN